MLNKQFTIPMKLHRRLVVGISLTLLIGTLLYMSPSVQAFIGRSRTGGVLGAGKTVRQPTNVNANMAAYFPFDGDAKDKAEVSQNNLSDNNTVTQSTGAASKAGSFASANGEYLATTSGTMDVPSQSFTFAAWVNLADKSAERAILSKYLSGSSGAYYLYYNSSSDRFTFLLANGTDNGAITASSFGSPSTNTWYYVVAWFDVSTGYASIQVNNGAIDTDIPGAFIVPQTTGQEFQIGARTGSSRYMDGKIDEVGFWKRTLTADERARLYNGGKGMAYGGLNDADKTNLISWWRLEEASGSRSDIHGSITLTDTNTVTQADGMNARYAGKAADFERDNSEYLSLSDNADIRAGDTNFTIATWVKFESINTSSIVAKDSVSGRDYTLDVFGGNFRFYINGGGAANLMVANGTAVADRWYYLVAWHDSGADTISLQVDNGTTVSVNTSGAVPATTSTAFNIGARQYSGNEDYTDGAIDAVGYWKRVLSAQERTLLYNNSLSLPYKDFSNSLKSHLVSYWNLDEDSGTRNDAHYHGQGHGTVTGATLANGKFGQAYSFDGTNDKIVTNYTQTSVTEYTISTWAKINSGNNQQVIFHNRGGDGYATNGHSLTLYTSAGAIQFAMESDALLIGKTTNAATYADGNWHHIVGVWEGSNGVEVAPSQFKIYIDGSEITSTTENNVAFTTIPTAPISGLGPATIGRHGAWDTWLNGSVDDLRVYTDALSASDVSGLYGGSNPPKCDQTCVGWWKLDEKSGTAAADASGKQRNNLLDVNTVTSTTGKVGNAAQFTATNSEYLSLEDNANLSTGNIDFTVAAWVYMDSKSGYNIFVSRESGGSSSADREYNVFYNPATDRFIFSLFGSSRIDVSANTFGSPSTGTWYYVVAWHDAAADTVNIQINDGTVDSVSTGGVAPSDTNRPFRIGETDSAYYMDGRIDEVGFWKRVLASGERSTLYNSGNGKTVSSLLTGEQHGLVSWWAMEESSGARNDSWGGNGFYNQSPTLGADGIFSSAVTLSNTPYVWMSDAPDYRLTTGSVAGWIKTTDAGSSHRGIIVKEWEYGLFLKDNILTAFSWSGNLGDKSTGINLADNTWHHVAMTFTSGAANGTKVYIDGRLVLTTDITVNYQNKALYIGASTSAGQTFTGSIDDVRIYNRILVAEEIAEQYMAGRP